ncbi:AraC family transcriptional regulator [bacterium]|nr:MAG: AraC family transcriptional regulator [bacterium]
MQSALFENVDYVHIDPYPELDIVTDCGWYACFGRHLDERREFPLYQRRELYHRILAIPHHHRDFIALYIVRAGRGTRVVNGYAHSIARGDVFLMAPSITHCFHAPINLTVDALYFQQELWSEREWEILLAMPDLANYLGQGHEAFVARGNTDHFGHLSPEPHARVEGTLAEMRAELESGNLTQHLAARARLFTLLVQLAKWREDKTFCMRPARGAGIAEVLAFCEGNFHRALCNEQLAGLMYFSEGHFREVFSREVGMSPGAYLRHLRLQHAQKLLQDKTLPIADIARLSGFGDSCRLAHAFKKAFGVSPLEFRKKRSNVF